MQPTLQLHSICIMPSPVLNEAILQRCECIPRGVMHKMKRLDQPGSKIKILDERCPQTFTTGLTIHPSLSFQPVAFTSQTAVGSQDATRHLCDVLAGVLKPRGCETSLQLRSYCHKAYICISSWGRIHRHCHWSHRSRWCVPTPPGRQPVNKRFERCVFCGFAAAAGRRAVW